MALHPLWTTYGDQEEEERGGGGEKESLLLLLSLSLSERALKAQRPKAPSTTGRDLRRASPREREKRAKTTTRLPLYVVTKLSIICPGSQRFRRWVAFSSRGLRKKSRFSPAASKVAWGLAPIHIQLFAFGGMPFPGTAARESPLTLFSPVIGLTSSESAGRRRRHNA